MVYLLGSTLNSTEAPTHLFQRLTEGVVRGGHQPYDALVGKRTVGSVAA